MRRVLIVGAGSGVGPTLAKSLLVTHELWTTSNSSQVQLPTQHFSWNAASQAFPAESLPDSETPLAAKLLRSERQQEAAAGRHPLGRIGQPADIADAARFLLSKQADWITGQILSVDGGTGSLRRFG